MKKSILMITLVMVFGLFCNTSLWAGNGSRMKDGSMLSFTDLEHSTISGTVSDTGVAGSGLTVDEGNGVFTTVYGMGSLSYWDSLGVTKPTVGESVAIDAVSVTFSDLTTRLIAVSISIEGEDAVLLRDEDGTPAWRGINKLKGSNGIGDCTACPNNGTCDKAQGGGTRTCPLMD